MDRDYMLYDYYIKEFIAVVKHLKRGKCRFKGNYLIVKKEIVIELLEKNAYETAANKLRVWKGLRWIETDEQKLTKRVVDKNTGQRLPYLSISLNVFKTLEKLNVK